MYHHLKIAEQELKPSGKVGEVYKGGILPIKKIGFTVSYAGNVDKLISRIVYNIKLYGKFIPQKFSYIVKPADFIFKDNYNGTVWSVNIEKSKRVRYLNFQTEIQCSR